MDALDAALKEPVYQFSLVQKQSFASLQDSEIRDSLTKWNLLPLLEVKSFRYTGTFQLLRTESFLRQLINSPSVQEVMQTMSINGKKEKWSGTCSRVKFTELSATIFNMDFFEPLFGSEVVKDNGSIVRCLDEYVDEFTISDRLRDMCLRADDSDYINEVFNDKQRKEFIYHVFRRLVIGGAVCQFEDTVQPLLVATKSLYKDLVSVKKKTKIAEGEFPLTIGSRIFLLEDIEGEAMNLFPHPNNRGNFLYVTVDPAQKKVTIVFYPSLPVF